MKNKPLIIELRLEERIIAVVPEKCAGPGWVNAPTWVYIMGPDKAVRIECIQPEERSVELNTLFEVGEVVTKKLLRSIPTKRNAHVPSI